ncbi:acyltransferase domain-containing protein [Nocardiopsis alba]|uniref:type I polyketide synthase n=1 Tax=Nocardiopsis alba TaxID=53437 RepID=UPI003F4CE29F
MSGAADGAVSPDTWQPVAVVGLACRLPGAPEPEAFWRLLSEGREAISAPPERLGTLSPERGHDWGGYLDDVAGFDAPFFGLSPREAVATDPQQRLMLELGWEAVENARVAPGTLRGSRVGVFVGAIGSDHHLLQDRGGADAITRHTLTGTHRSLIANRLSHTMGLRGPSLTIDAGQASSLVGVHMAVESLRRGESELALAGGVSLILVPESTEAVVRFGGLSPDARCHTFDSRANGYVRGEGGAVVLLKPLSRALADGDRVHAVVHGGAVNHSGAGEYLTRPTAAGQEAVIRAAYENSGQRPDRVGYVELHGTGTPAGDPVEARALGSVFSKERPDPLRVGSAKTNVGHLEGAAGIVGLVKTVLSLDHQTLPPSLNFVEPNPDIDLEALRLSVQTRREPWPGHAPLAGVSAFAMGGTNCHMVLGPAPLPEQGTVDNGGSGARALDPVPWVLSARSETALREQASALHAHVSSRKGTRAQDVGLSLATTRDVFEHRAVVFASGEGSTRELESVLPEGQAPMDADTPGPVLVFPGQGGQWAEMGRDLLAGDGVLARAFAQRIRACERALEPHVDWSLTAVLRGDPQAPVLIGEGARVDVVQPTLWAVMVSLARVWETLGVRPAAVVGHSQGELAAACVAGALTLEEAARVMALRGRALTGLGGSGAMASLGMSAIEAETLTESLPDLYLAAINGPNAVVVSGEPDSVREAVRRCVDQGLHGAMVDVDYASHSAQVERIRARLFSYLGRVRWQRPKVPFYSTLTGRELGEDSPDLDASYWYSGLREPVLFAPAVAALAGAGYRTFLEVGPHPVLSYGIRRTLAEQGIRGRVLETLRRGEGDQARLLTAAAHAFTAGVDVDWAGLFEGTGARRTDLPTYRFQRERHWPRTPVRRPEGASGRSDDLLPDQGVELVDGRTVFSGRIDEAHQPWVRDHGMLGRTVLSGTAVLELALHAGDAVGAGAVEGLDLTEPVLLSSGDRTTHVQVTVGAVAENGTRRVEVHSRGTSDGEWVHHALGTLAPDRGRKETAEPAAWPPPEAVAVDLDPDEAYGRLARRGHTHGPLNRGLREVWRLGDTLLARVVLPSGHGLPSSVTRSLLLDASLHAVLLFGPRTEGPPLVPVEWRGVRVLSTSVPTEARVALEPVGPDRYRVTVTDRSGIPLLEAEQVRLRSLESETLPPPQGEEPGLYRLFWEPLSLPESDGRMPVGLVSPADLAGGGPVPDTVYAELPAREVYAEHEPVPDAVSEAVEAALATVRDWLTDPRTVDSRLVLITWRAVVTSGEDRLGGPAAAPVWGVVRSIQREHPGRVVLVDSDGSEDSHRVLVDAVSTGRPQLALRSGAALAPRLAPACEPERPVPPAAAWRLGPDPSGSARGPIMTAAPEATVRLDTGQVRISVRAAGVGQRDVAVGLGLLDERMGLEGAGVVVETAADVTDLAPGDRVMGVFRGALGPLAVADRRALVRVPEGWDLEQAASVPLSFLIAYHALVDVAGVRPGESVLVHSAAGGVGLAAVQLARYMGARVFGTAAPHKWALPEEYGVPPENLASSRDLDFEDRLRAANGDRGLDVVLNSLTGRFVDASLRLLRSPADGAGAGGRLVELGVTDVRSEAEVAAAHPGRGYHPLDLSEVCPDRVATVLSRVTELFEAGTLRPLPVTVYDVHDAREALEALRRGDHVGRTVLTFPEPFPAGTTVLVTGGTGEIGHRTARHLVAGYGVRHLVLVGPGGAAAPGQDGRTGELRALGAEVEVKACDVADREALSRLLGGLERPLGAVVHTEDAVLDESEPIDGVAALRNRVNALWNLHELTLDRELRSFVLFSSAGGVLGAPGRHHSAAADAFSDSLAHHRRERGLPATSLAWGRWGGLGLSSENPWDGGVLAPMPPDRALAKLDAALYLESDVYVPALVNKDDAPEHPFLPGVGTTPGRGGPPRGGARRTRKGRSGPPAEPTRPVVAPPPPVPSTEPKASPERLASLPEGERERVLLGRVRAHTAEVLGHAGVAAVPADRSFRDLGLDSMGAVELRNRLSGEVGARLTATAVFDHPNPRALARLLVGLVALGDTRRSEEEPAATRGTDAGPARDPRVDDDHGVDDIDDMDVDDLLDLALGAEHLSDGEQETADGHR